MKTALLLIALVIIGVFIYSNRKSMLPIGAPATGGTPAMSSVAPAGTGAPASNATTVINLTPSGFVPQTLMVAPGTRITWINQTNATATVNSDDHPTHLKWPWLNLGNFGPGSSLSTVFPTEPGTYTYHDHFHPQFKGSIVVK